MLEIILFLVKNKTLKYNPWNYLKAFSSEKHLAIQKCSLVYIKKLENGNHFKLVNRAAVLLVCGTVRLEELRRPNRSQV